MYVMLLLIQGRRQNFVIWRLLTPRCPLYFKSKELDEPKVECDTRCFILQMCFIEVTITMKNPSLYSLHFYILENYKYAHNSENT